jgi:putative flippase GtrA
MLGAVMGARKDAPSDRRPPVLAAAAMAHEPARPPGDRLRSLLGEAFRFGLVGVAGYLVDVAVVTLIVRLGIDPFTARVPSFIAAASVTWYLNRRFTFRRAPRGGGAVRRQWLLFVVLMLPGAALNYGTYAILVAHWPLARAHLALPVAAGALAGMTINFIVSKMIVFRP